MKRPARPRPLARPSLPSRLPRTVRDRDRGALVVRAIPRFRTLGSLALAGVSRDIPLPAAIVPNLVLPAIPAATAKVAASVVAVAEAAVATVATVTTAITPQPDAMALRGELWEISYQQRKGVIHDCRGLRYLALLVRDTGGGREPVHAKELAGLASGDRGGAIELEMDDAVLDQKARKQLIARLEEIATERDRAAAVEDFTKAEKLDDEYERIADELSRAGSTRGSSRRKVAFNHTGEKARKAVAKAIAEAIAKIAAHPDLAALGEHFTAKIRKGQWLSYDGPADWRIDFTPSLPASPALLPGK